MNVPHVPSSNALGLHKSTRSVQAQVVTLERVQQVYSSYFTVSHVVQQQHPRFNDINHGNKQELDSMRSVLHSCWNLPHPQAPTTVATRLGSTNPRHAQLQRLRRGWQLTGVPSNSSQAASRGSPDAAVQSSGKKARSSSSQAADAGSGLLPAAETHNLSVLMDLWHIFTTSQANNSYTSDRPPSVPRLLTSDEEHVLGTIIQQHRKLKQLFQEHPEAAAAAFGSPAVARQDPMAADSVSQHGSAAGQLPQLSSSSRKADKRHKWPPPLTPADIAEVAALPPAYRAMLPQLATQAVDLLVAFNTALVFVRLRLSNYRQDVPTADLMAAGLAALRHAALRFDPGRGTKFSTVATPWIAQHIQRSSIVHTGSALRRPEQHHDMLRYVLSKHGVGVLQSLKSRPDVVEEVASEFNARPATVLHAIQATSLALNSASMEAAAVSHSSKQDNTGTTFSVMLSTADLDEDTQPGSGSDFALGGSHGSMLASAGKVPGWITQSAMRPLVQTPSAGLHHHQQQPKSSQQLGPEGAAAAAAGSLAADAASIATASMLSTFEEDDLQGMEQQMASLLHVLTPLERDVITTLYGLGDVAPQGLGVDMDSWTASFLDSTGRQAAQCSGKGSSSRQSRFGADRLSASGCISSSSSLEDDDGAADASSSSSSSSSLQGMQRVHRIPRGVMSLVDAAKKVGLGSHQYVAILRNRAWDKLAAAAREGGDGQQPLQPPETGRQDEQQQQQQQPRKLHPDEVEVVIRRLPGMTKHHIRLLQQYVAEFGTLPEGSGVQYGGRKLGCWCDRMREQYRSSMLQPQLVAVMEAAFPEWTWEVAAKPRTRRQVAQAVAERAAAAVPAGLASSDGGQAASSLQRSPRGRSTALLIALRKRHQQQLLTAGLHRNRRQQAELAAAPAAAPTAAPVAAPAAGVQPQLHGSSRAASKQAAGQKVPKPAAAPAAVAVQEPPDGSSTAATKPAARKQPAPQKAPNARIPAAAAAAAAADARSAAPSAVAGHPQPYRSINAANNQPATAVVPDTPPPAAQQMPSRTFKAYLQVLASFMHAHGRLPRSNEQWQGMHVGNWFRTQRYKLGAGKLTPQCAAALSAVIPAWLTQAAERRQSPHQTFERFLQALASFMHAHGRLPRTREQWQGMHVGNWLGTQRYKLGAGKLKPQYAAALSAISPHWDSVPNTPPVPHKTFEPLLQALASFIHAHGRLPRSDEQWQAMHVGNWLRTQRYKLGAGKLKPQCVAALSAVSPDWNKVPRYRH